MDIDVNKPLENPALCALLRKRQTINAADKKALNDCINEIVEEIVMNARFLVIAQFNEGNLTPRKDGQAVFNRNTVISFPFFGTESPFLPAFTDWRELRKGHAYKETDVKTFIFSFDDCCTLLKENNAGLVINPFSDNLVFSYEDIKRFQEIKEFRKTGHKEIVIEKETKVLLGEPKDFPTEMTQAIINYAQNEENIKAIWLKLMITENEKSFLLIVDFSGDRKRTFDGIGNAVRPYLSEGMFLDMIPLKDNFGQSAATGKPFYKKERSPFWKSFLQTLTKKK
ncbi:MAG: enhanced serine sensitivity protein SseB [Elusimicrobiales bacterium]|nr:enhanced serine sensitivity protein SseB [Elusimicrobiales bacterium]